jgi:dolichol-phosphate mannosyltransferase
MSKEFYVSVILPCYNESGSILELIEEIHSQLNFCKHEVVLVDDNSPDGTYELVKKKNLNYVKPVLRTTDPSLAKSIRKGLEESEGNVFVVMDSDFNHQPQYLPILIKNLEFYDAVFASRFVYGGAMDTRLRHRASWLFNMFVRILTDKALTENLYGYYAIKRKIMEKLDYNKIFWGFGDYCIRMTYYLQIERATVLQIPAANGKRKAGKGNTKFTSTFYKYTVETIKLALINLKRKS